jgi:trans-aconitate 2-methyltransferase
MSRTRGAADLLARVSHPAPRLIIDLGCGPGNNTELIAQRWPDALVIGVDKSPAMISAARERERPGHLEFRQADIIEWQPDEPADIVLLNAVLQWIPDHTALLPRFAAMLAPAGVLGFQIPGTPSGSLRTPPDNLAAIACVMAREPQWRAQLSEMYADTELPGAMDYIAALENAGLRAEVWETWYTYPMAGTGRLAEYASGAVLQPALAALAPDEAERFLAEYSRRASEVFPPRVIRGEPVELIRAYRVFAIGRSGSL